MLCKKCGAEIKDSQKFCSKCGEKVELEENITAEITNSKHRMKKSIVIMIAVVLIIIVVFSAFLIVSNNSDKLNENISTTTQSNGSKMSTEEITEMTVETKQLSGDENSIVGKWVDDRDLTYVFNNDGTFTTYYAADTISYGGEYTIKNDIITMIISELDDNVKCKFQIKDNVLTLILIEEDGVIPDEQVILQFEKSSQIGD